jgi:ribosome-associated protein
MIPLVKNHFHEFDFVSQRSRGPGGQNVNKTNSSVQLRWDFRSSSLLSEEQKDLIHRKCAAIINTDGILFIRSDVFRDLDQNRKEVLKRLQERLMKVSGINLMLKKLVKINGIKRTNHQALD